MRGKQRRVLYVQGQLEKSCRSFRQKDLRSSSPIAYGLVKSTGGIVLKTCFFQYAGRGRIETQPMHANTGMQFTCCLGESAPFLKALLCIVPAIDTVNADFVARAR